MTETTNGRVTTRDVLTAVDDAASRISHRIDRLEDKIEGHHALTDARLVTIEIERAKDSAHERGQRRALSAAKAFVVTLVSVGAAAAAALATIGFFE